MRIAVQERYDFVAGFDAEWAHVLWFIRTESPYFTETATALCSIADWTEYDLRGLGQ